MRARPLSLVAFAGLLLLPSTSHAGHHLWKFSQLFSNAAGSVQFMQLFTTDSGEPGVGPFTITTGSNTFNFVNNLPTSATANTWILIATSNFAGLKGGVTPDYVIPASFFSTGGGTLNYAGVDSWSYGAVPTDGVHSLMRDGSTPVNAPTNFAGQTGSVSLATSVPAIPTLGIALLIGALLLAGSGLLRRRRRVA
jgi:serralysin